MCIIEYDLEFGDFYHEGYLIINLETFIKETLLNNKEIKFVKI